MEMEKAQKKKTPPPPLLLPLIVVMMVSKPVPAAAEALRESRAERVQASKPFVWRWK
jgi:hypothetical protein